MQDTYLQSSTPIEDIGESAITMHEGIVLFGFSDLDAPLPS